MQKFAKHIDSLELDLSQSKDDSERALSEIAEMSDQEEEQEEEEEDDDDLSAPMAEGEYEKKLQELLGVTPKTKHMPMQSSGSQESPRGGRSPTPYSTTTIQGLKRTEHDKTKTSKSPSR
jgi:hypothetical protein